MVAVSSWGRLSHFEHRIITADSAAAIKAQFKPNHSILPFGNGRSYGDVCLNPSGDLLDMRLLDRFIEFNQDTGVLKCEAGILLRDIQRLMIPRGWILPVTPGTQLITVGGAVANDVHGKNHHVAGNFGHHIKKLTLMRTNGELLECSPQFQPEMFYATLGGMGLTGVILTAEIQLKRVLSPWLEVETIPYSDLDTFFALADDSEQAWEYTVSWVDCTNAKSARGIFMRGNFIEADVESMAVSKKNVTIAMPFIPPVSLVNRCTLKPFNMAYFYKHKWGASHKNIDYQSFFYPLDSITDWNRMYGPQGFYQYQCVIPSAFQHDAIREMLHEISKSGEGSFLAVLKTFGKRASLGMLSFPMQGATLALDFHNAGSKTLRLFEALDAIVAAAKGRIYMAKDARMPKSLFEASYPRLSEFMQYRVMGISSGLSRRLMGN